MRYTDLNGLEVEGEVWAPGASASTVWVLRPDRTAALVSVRGRARKELEYTPPEHLSAIEPATERTAEEIVQAYRESKRLFADLGVTPAGPEHAAAVQILKLAEQARKSRQPFTNAHGGNQAVSNATFKKLSEEE